MATDQSSDPAWSQLRALLLAQEQQRLAQLEAELAVQRRRANLQSDLPATLADLAEDDQLRASLARPVTAALHESIERDRDGVASLLFPVMGPAIRRAVQESLRGALQRINLALEYGLSPRAWRWRLQAWRSGESFAQIVLRHSLAYSVDEIFLIHRASGLVAIRRSRTEVLALDADAVASMLTAIQSFLQQSLGSVADDPLRTVELGSATLWLVNGPEVLLAAIIRGEAPLQLREELQETLESSHQRLGEQLTDFQGEALEDADVCALLDRHLIDQMATQKPARSVAWVWLLAGLVVLAWLGLVGWKHWQLSQEHRQLQQAIQQQPGMILVRSQLQDGQIHGLVLRDPLALSMAELEQQLGLPGERLALLEQGFVSSEPALVIRRLERALGLEPDTGLRLVPAGGGERLQIDQALSLHQWQQLSLALPLLQGDLPVTLPPLDSADLHTWLDLPDEIRLEWDGTHVRLSGTLVEDKLAAVRSALQQWPVVHQLDLSQLHSHDSHAQTLATIRQLVETITGARLNFSTGVQLTGAAREGLTPLTEQLKQLFQLTERLPPGHSPDYIIHLRGMSDGVGDGDENLSLRQARADTVRDLLIAAGIETNRIISTAAQDEAPAGFNPALRYAELRVETK